MKKFLMIFGILIIVLFAVLELVAGINKRDLSMILIGFFMIIVGISYFFETKNN